jgi:hypothetical protein
MPTKSTTYYPELPLFDIETMPTSPKPKVHRKREVRSQDSEGRFTIEVELPTPEVFQKTQENREMSVVKLLRIQAERIKYLEAELQLIKNG